MDYTSLICLEELMLAQGQEMVICKAINDNNQAKIISKLCAHVSEQFSNLALSMKKSDAAINWEPSWVRLISGKQTFYSGLAQYYQSKKSNF